MTDELLAKITELTNTVKENGGLNGLKKDELIADFKALLEEQRQKALEDAPARKGEEEIPESAQRAADAYKGRYKRMVQNIVKNGEHREGNFATRATDLWLAKIFIDKANDLKKKGMTFQGMEQVRPASEDLNAAVKLMTSTGTGTGDELVPENMAGDLWQDFFAAARITGDLPNQPMPSDPFDLSTMGKPTWRKGTQGTATTASDPATAGPKLTTTEMVAEVDWSYNLDEDAVLAMMPALRQDLALSGGEAMDAFVLNADATDAATGNINLDDADPAADAYYLSAGQDGIRHQWLVDNTGQGVNVAAAIDDAHMAEILAKLGKYGLDIANLRIAPDVATYLSMLGMTSVSTVDKYGSAATILTGELARYRGIPIIPSGELSLTEADGKVSNTAASNVKGQLSAYHRLMWKVGFRRGLTIEVDRLIQSRQLIMVASFRIAVGCRGTRSTSLHTAGGYDITL